MKKTVPLNPPIGGGEPSASVCAFCQALLAPVETYCCSDCEIELLDDPNYRMHGGVDD
ncbi:protein ninF [Pantoea sp. FDAARGOS_194]|nr:protein ninF [Pantoea sp. FDAARGOS_194]